MNRNRFLRTLTSLSLAATTVTPLLLQNNAYRSGDVKAKIIRSGEGKTINVIGDLQTIKLTGQDTNNQFTLIEEHNAPGTMIPLHVHSKEDEVFRVVEGQMELTVGDKTTVLLPGDIGFGPRGIPHSWKIVGEKNAKVILSVFPSGIELMFEELSRLPSGPPDLAAVAAICGQYGIEFV